MSLEENASIFVLVARYVISCAKKSYILYFGFVQAIGIECKYVA